MRRGEVERLKPEYRLALARDGYVLELWDVAAGMKHLHGAFGHCSF
jgi:hypothetical protein